MMGFLHTVHMLPFCGGVTLQCLSSGLQNFCATNLRQLLRPTVYFRLCKFLHNLYFRY